jgi:hypothetical protein
LTGSFLGFILEKLKGNNGHTIIIIPENFAFGARMHKKQEQMKGFKRLLFIPEKEKTQVR